MNKLSALRCYVMTMMMMTKILGGDGINGGKFN